MELEISKSKMIKRKNGKKRFVRILQKSHNLHIEMYELIKSKNEVDKDKLLYLLNYSYEIVDIFLKDFSPNIDYIEKTLYDFRLKLDELFDEGKPNC